MSEKFKKTCIFCGRKTTSEKDYDENWGIKITPDNKKHDACQWCDYRLAGFEVAFDKLKYIYPCPHSPKVFCWKKDCDKDHDFYERYCEDEAR